jgi:hypothetical protein
MLSALCVSKCPCAPRALTPSEPPHDAHLTPAARRAPRASPPPPPSSFSSAQSASAPRTLPAALFGLSTLFGSAEDAGRHQAHFVACGLMRALQAQRAGAGVDLARAIDALNGKFPNDVVAQLQPNYEDSLLQKIGESR